jgi:hypothetical protein
MCLTHRAVGGFGQAVLDMCQTCGEAADRAAAEPHRRVAESLRRIEQAVDRLRQVGYPESSPATYITAERKFLRGRVSMEHAGLRYWHVGTYQWTWSEDSPTERFRVLSREGTSETVVSEQAAVYRLSDPGLAKGYAPRGSLIWPDKVGDLSSIAERLEEIVLRHDEQVDTLRHSDAQADRH